MKGRAGLKGSPLECLICNKLLVVHHGETIVPCACCSSCGGSGQLGRDWDSETADYLVWYPCTACAGTGLAPAGSEEITVVDWKPAAQERAFHRKR